MPDRQVLFVCEHGAAKSVFAGSYFNLLAERAGLSARAIARGVSPDDDIAERVRQEAAAAGMPLCTSRPMQLGEADVATADMVVSFDLTLSDSSRGPQAAWDGLPSLKQHFESGRAEIMSRVEALVAEVIIQSDRGVR